MTQQFPQQPLRTSPQPFSEVNAPTLTSDRFWVRLLTYRPLFLLGGLWLVLVCVSAIAYQGLMFNEPLEDTAQAEAPLTVVNTLPQTSPSVDSSSSTDSSTSTQAAAPADQTAQSGSMTLWALLSLVGLCSFGCLALTQQIRASTRPAKRKKPRPRLATKTSITVRSAQPKRLTPYSPQRDGVVVPGVRPIADSAPRRSPQPLPMRPQPSRDESRSVAALQPQRGAKARPQANRPVQPQGPATAPVPSRHPAVVPREADLSLDWPEGSVAHALDVRQRRSLSSFM